MSHTYSKNILFIEDEPNLIDIYHKIFDKHNYYFCSTSKIDEGMLIAKTAGLDAILLDIVLPKIEGGVVNIAAKQGYDFLEQVKQEPKTKDIPVIVLTNLNTQVDRKKSYEMGAVDYIVKADHDPEFVFQAVEKVIQENEAKKGKK